MTDQAGNAGAAPVVLHSRWIQKKQISEFTETTLTILGNLIGNLSVLLARNDRFHPTGMLEGQLDRVTCRIHPLRNKDIRQEIKISVKE